MFLRFSYYSTDVLNKNIPKAVSYPVLMGHSYPVLMGHSYPVLMGHSYPVLMGPVNGVASRNVSVICYEPSGRLRQDIPPGLRPGGSKKR
jgi:hypothetical protein